MYYFITNTEDGLRVSKPLDHDEAMELIGELTSEDLRPECRAAFTDQIPTPYTDERNVCIIKGEPIIPKAVKLVTEYHL